MRKKNGNAGTAGNYGNTVTVDPDSLSFIPQNPDVELKDIMTVCKEDALKEASESKELYQTAEENLQSAIEALLSTDPEKMQDIRCSGIYRRP